MVEREVEREAERQDQLMGVLSPTLNMLMKSRCAISGHTNKVHWKLNPACHQSCVCSKLVLLVVYIIMEGGWGRQHKIIFLEGMCFVSLVFTSFY